MALQGTRLRLRAREPADAHALHVLWSDTDTWSLGTTVPYVPETEDNVRRRLELEAATPASDSVWLTAELLTEQAEGTAIGMAGLWGIDQFNRRAHVSVAVMPECRAIGYGTEILAVLCDYAFGLRGLRRLEVETLARNGAMQSLARRGGFIDEGTLRQRDYDNGRWSDVLVYGLLATELPRPDRAGAGPSE